MAEQEQARQDPRIGPGSPVPGEAAAVPVAANDKDLEEAIEHPARLLRIASTVQTMFQEVKSTELDEAARQRLTEIHNRSIEQLRELVSPDLEAELDAFTFDEDELPTGPELRVMQAQLSGWLQGLFHGIQASMATQQLAAQQQLARMRQQQQQEQAALGQPGSGQYL